MMADSLFKGAGNIIAAQVGELASGIAVKLTRNYGMKVHYQIGMIRKVNAFSETAQLVLLFHLWNNEFLGKCRSVSALSAISYRAPHGDEWRFWVKHFRNKMPGFGARFSNISSRIADLLQNPCRLYSPEA